MLEQAAAGACCRRFLLVSAAAVLSRLEEVSLLVCGSPSRCFHCMLVWFAVWL